MGFAQIRRADRALDPERAARLLARAKWGVLSLGPDEMGYPHAVPINCAYVGGRLLLHCARQGKKIDMIQANPRACFTAVLSERLAPERYTTEYESVICYGTVELLPPDETARALTLFTAAVFELPEADVAAKAASAAPKTQMLQMTIDHMTGKGNLGDPD